MILFSNNIIDIINKMIWNNLKALFGVYRPIKSRAFAGNAVMATVGKLAIMYFKMAKNLPMLLAYQTQPEMHPAKVTV